MKDCKGIIKYMGSLESMNERELDRCSKVRDQDGWPC